MSQEIVRFDPKGDVILATNHGSYLLVSSKCLTEASSVFEKLLEDVSPTDTGSAPVVQVIDYYAPALNFACGLIHGKDPSSWQPKTPLELFHFAVACRYEFECSQRTDWLLRIIFEGFAFDVQAVDDIVDLLATAMVCNFKVGFQILSKLLVYESTVPLTRLITRESGLHIGKPRLEAMELERLKLQAQLLECLSNLLTPSRCVGAACTVASHEAGGLIYELDRVQIWPLSLSSMSVGYVVRKLAQFCEPDISVVLRRMGGWFVGCEHPHAVRCFVDEVAAIRKVISNAYRGLTSKKQHLDEPVLSSQAVRVQVRTSTGLVGHFRLHDCHTVDIFFQQAEDILSKSGRPMRFSSMFVELPWAIGLQKAVRIERGDSGGFAGLLNRISEAIQETGNEDAVFVANICTGTNG